MPRYLYTSYITRTPYPFQRPTLPRPLPTYQWKHVPHLGYGHISHLRKRERTSYSDKTWVYFYIWSSGRGFTTSLLERSNIFIRPSIRRHVSSSLHASPRWMIGCPTGNLKFICKGRSSWRQNILWFKSLVLCSVVAWPLFDPRKEHHVSEKVYVVEWVTRRFRASLHIPIEILRGSPLASFAPGATLSTQTDQLEYRHLRWWRHGTGDTFFRDSGTLRTRKLYGFQGL